MKGLEKNGVRVIECNVLSFNRLLNYIKLLKKFQKFQTSKYDVIVLGARGRYFGQPLMPFIKRMTKKPVVFDATLTLYETEVVDRKLIDGKSIKAKLWYLFDYNALQNASLVLSDTNTHAKYYSHFYDVDFSKFRRVLVGSDDEVFYPKQSKKEDNCFLVMFWGTFIPLQGVKYIIRAARLLENCKDVKFELRGFGQTYSEALELFRSLRVKNTTFASSWVPYNELPNYVAKADVCLGIFGETEKAKRVIPNKAVETLAMRKPLITGDSPAAREILTDRENCILVPMANPKALAEAILRLKEDEKLGDKIAENGYRLFKERLSPEAIGKDLKSTLMELIEKSR
jgi:glycosyltransferase involved in cell wall biosynthesis